MVSEKKALMVASVASMIDLFNRENIVVLKELGYAVDVVANFDSGSITDENRVAKFKLELEADGIKVYNLPISRSIADVKNILKSYRELKRIVDGTHYDIVHCLSPIGGAICRVACIKARKRGTKVLYMAHGFHFFDGAPVSRWLLYYPIERFLSRFTDMLLTINPEDYERTKKFHAKKICKVPGIGVHTEEIKNRTVDRVKLRCDFGYTEGDFVYLSVGQISVRKNHKVAIEALSRIADQRVKYLIIGFGELEEELKALVKQLKLQDRVVFAGYRSDVWDVLHVVDGFVFPSLQEGLPVALMEAMSAGLPIVCSRIRGNVDLIKDGEGGFLCDSSDVDGFARRMKQIVEMAAEKSDRLEFMKQTNLNTMKKNDASVVRRQMKRIYKYLEADRETN